MKASIFFLHDSKTKQTNIKKKKQYFRISVALFLSHYA